MALFTQKSPLLNGDHLAMRLGGSFAGILSMTKSILVPPLH
jgi:hypothetical protein